MSAIDITRRHSLDHAEAVKAADSLAENLSQRYDVNYEWDGDVLRFKRSGVKGELTVNPEIIHVHLELGLMLRPFKGRIEQEIHDHLDGLTQKA